MSFAEDEVQRLWRLGRNTLEIASGMGLKEADVEVMLHRWMDKKYTIARGEQANDQGSSV